ncbi:YdcF family protein [Rhodococcus sp. T7]|uniref:YdcF family protein n=1 Tax=Rhodococcus sp. T7 TaxID=627444 RepID=UPI002E2B6BC2|nr:YdcF family protein [Rhodococcus sp. T7]
MSVLAMVIGGVGIAGYFVYTKSHVDPVKPVDAIIVLGGEHDGREEYAIGLARRGVSKNLVLSNAYGTGDKKMVALCATKDPRFTVTCIPPIPATTRGEAQFTRDLAERNGWSSILVITWRYHLPRARYIFSQCFDGEIVMHPVPRDYNFSLAEWEYAYLYQTVGFAKAFLQGRC